MRDPEKVKLEMEQKDQVLMDVAKKLFLEKRIEAVTMDEIIKASGFGKATVFRHYKNKCLLVIDLMAREWKAYMDDLDLNRPISGIHDIPAINRFIYTLDSYIDMYQNHKDLLILNDNFNHYVTHAVTENEQEALGKFQESLISADTRFHLMYEKAKMDGTMRTDIPEEEFFRITLHIMMATCEHYAGGFIWRAKKAPDKDYTSELVALKQMLILFATPQEE